MVLVVFGYLCADASLQFLDEYGHALLFNPTTMLHRLQQRRH